MGSKLDWNRMLGFEQITDVRGSGTLASDAPDRDLKTGVKLGNKIGNKVGNKIGSKQGIKA